MKKKSDKEKDLEALKKDFEKAQNIFVTGFEKLTVQQDFELRKTVRGAGGNYKVIKNNLAEKAAEGTPAEDLLRDLAGMTSLAYTSKDPVALAKALTAYAKANPSVHLQGGLGGRPGDRCQVDPAAGGAAGRGRDFRESSVS